MGLAEVEEFEGVGRGVIGLIRLWKCVENSKPQVQNRPREPAPALYVGSFE